MNLGQNYLALAVKDISASLAFYQKLGFEPVPDCGGIDQKWLMLKNGETQIGLFQDMFPENVITFNPPNVRSIQKSLKVEGIQIDNECDETNTGPAYIMLKDPDGNQILMDQH